MKRVLLVSIAFPPKNDPECLQVAKYLKYMAQADLNFDIVTSSIPTLFMPYDSSLEKYSFPGMQKIEIPVWETKISNYVLQKAIPGGISYPDSKLTFHLQYRKVIKRLRNVPDIIYSRSNPVSSAVMACKLREYYKVPWVMHLSDPWVGSPARYGPSWYSRPRNPMLSFASWRSMK